jgi:hypothetical protein
MYEEVEKCLSDSTRKGTRALLDRETDALAYLEDRITLLSTKLEPIMLQSTPCVGAGAATKVEAISSIGDSVNNHLAKVDYIIQKIHDIIDRIDL